jgi:cobalt transporter subunit CbtB
MSISTSSTSAAGVGAKLTARWPLFAVVASGLAIVYVVGFAGPHAIHEAAHDSRHSLNFPCH